MLIPGLMGAGKTLGADELILTGFFSLFDSLVATACYYYFVIAVAARTLTLDVVTRIRVGHDFFLMLNLYAIYFSLTVLRFCSYTIASVVVGCFSGFRADANFIAMIVMIMFTGMLFVVLFREVMLSIYRKDLSFLYDHLFENSADAN